MGLRNRGVPVAFAARPASPVTPYDGVVGGLAAGNVDRGDTRVVCQGVPDIDATAHNLHHA